MDPEVIQPGEASSRLRTRMGRSVFTDENLDLLAHVLDDCFQIPGTPIRFGIDGLIGLVPFAGDILAGLASSIIVMAAWFRGVPYVTLARMVINIAIDVLVGMVPLVGDAFDIAWKANRRNYNLLIRDQQSRRRHTWHDWLFVVGASLMMLLLFLAPFLLLMYVLKMHNPLY